MIAALLEPVNTRSNGGAIITELEAEAANLPAKDEARRIAANLTKLAGALRSNPSRGYRKAGARPEGVGALGGVCGLGSFLPAPPSLTAHCTWN